MFRKLRELDCIHRSLSQNVEGLEGLSCGVVELFDLTGSIIVPLGTASQRLEGLEGLSCGVVEVVGLFLSQIIRSTFTGEGVFN